MTSPETAADCLSLLDRHTPPDFSRVRMTPADFQALAKQGFQIGIRVSAPRAPIPRNASRAKPLPKAGKLARGGLAELGRILAEKGYDGSISVMAERYGVLASSLSNAIMNGRRFLGLAAPARPKAPRTAAMIAAIEECRTTPYRHGLWAATARKHGVPKHQLEDHLRADGITRTSAQALKFAA